MLRQLPLFLFAGIIISGFTFLNTTWTFGGLPPAEKIYYEKNGNPDWLVVREDVQISAEEMIRQQKTNLGLGPDDELVLYRTDADDLGFVHYRYQHYHRGTKVEGSELLVHEKDGTVQTLNGKLARGIDVNKNAGITPEKALTIALTHLPAERYMWESEQAERLLKRIRKNPDATYYPVPEKVMIDPTFKQEAGAFRLAYQVIIHSMIPHGRKLLFIDAQSGSILRELEMIHTQQVQNQPGDAETKYSGLQEIIADSFQVDAYRLRESIRGGGIETYDMNQGGDFDLAEDFLDDNNFWNNVNDEQDEAATDAHWGAEMTFDYFLQEHNHSGLDGNNFPMISYVHVFENWFNASWNGIWVSYGDGNPNNGSSAFTGLDVVGHEFAHGLNNFSADLIYQNESGALNESFSDIFGTAIEFWATPDAADWLIGEDFLGDDPLRDMSNPNEFDDPDTYRGEFWVTGSFDNGGVHTNSGVQNHWFYLLSHGGSGTNDNFDDYQVDSIGIKNAEKIAFRNLQYYLTRFSEYEDAREGSLVAAADLFGLCSDIHKEVAKAWYAVGVGPENFASDMRLASIQHPGETLLCGPEDEEFISVLLTYRDCDVILEPGEKIPMAYQIDDDPVIWDTLTLTTPMQAGDTLLFTYPSPVVAFSTPGKYKLRCWSEFPQDVLPGNNTITFLVETALSDANDIGSTRMQQPAPGCFLGNEKVEIEVAFFGCDSISAGLPVDVFYRINNGPVVGETVEIPQTLFRNETFNYVFDAGADLTIPGYHRIHAWAKVQDDVFPANDSLPVFRVVSPVAIFNQDIVTFEADQASLDSFYFQVNDESGVFISKDAAKNGNFGLQIAGGDAVQAFQDGILEMPDNDNVWFINPEFRSKVCFCADLTGLPDAELRFRLKQTYSPFYNDALGENLPFASAARVLVNSEQLGFNFKPSEYTSDPYRTQKFSLEDYLGATAEICFEFATLLNENLDPNEIGDNAYLDDVTIVSSVTNVKSELLPEGSLTVFPNPGNGRFRIAVEAPMHSEAVIQVTDVQGRAIQTMEQNMAKGNNTIELDLNEAMPGIYFLRMQLGNAFAIQEIVVLP